jgi:hypothetical protein
VISNTLTLIDRRFSEERTTEDGLFDVLFEVGSIADHIGHSAFRRRGMRKVRIGKSVKTLNEGCFESCSSLEEITFEANSQLRRIESGAFAVPGLGRTTIPNSVERFDLCCFESCDSLEEITFEAYTFAESGLLRMTFPGSVTFVC